MLKLLNSLELKFQHTAARRRLPMDVCYGVNSGKVSTHSRAEAAACNRPDPKACDNWFQHTAARRRLHFHR